MKTRSLWGKAPTRFYRFVTYCKKILGQGASICIVGCSDGKFVFPFLRQGFHVTGIELDTVAINGGYKIGPEQRHGHKKMCYSPSNKIIKYTDIPSIYYSVTGLKQRAIEEGMSSRLKILQTDFYHNAICKTFDVVFTSCSIQYKVNRDLSLDDALSKLKEAVKPGGILYMDYMMPLEDQHVWKSHLFLRTGQIRSFFQQGWTIKYIREMKRPVFEAAHIDRPEDHFHRYGYIFVQKYASS